jgi:hypothetical protein
MWGGALLPHLRDASPEAYARLASVAREAEQDDVWCGRRSGEDSVLLHLVLESTPVLGPEVELKDQLEQELTSCSAKVERRSSFSASTTRHVGWTSARSENSSESWRQRAQPVEPSSAPVPTLAGNSKKIGTEGIEPFTELPLDVVQIHEDGNWHLNQRPALGGQAIGPACWGR